jgi:hypothetical protein
VTLPKPNSRLRHARSALQDLDLDELVIIHAGAESYPLASRIRAVGLTRLREDLPSMKPES